MKKRAPKSAMHAQDDHASATKQDIRLLMEQFGSHLDSTRSAIRASEARVETRLVVHEENIKRYFDLRVEDIRHDLLGAHADDIASMKDDIQSLKRHTGLAPV